MRDDAKKMRDGGGWLARRGLADLQGDKTAPDQASVTLSPFEVETVPSCFAIQLRNFNSWPRERPFTTTQPHRAPST